MLVSEPSQISACPSFHLAVGGWGGVALKGSALTVGGWGDVDPKAPTLAAGGWSGVDPTDSTPACGLDLLWQDVWKRQLLWICKTGKSPCNF